MSAECPKCGLPNLPGIELLTGLHCKCSEPKKLAPVSDEWLTDFLSRQTIWGERNVIRAYERERGIV